MKKSSLSFLLICIGIVGCKPKFESEVIQAGDADFSKIVAVSGSNGAGYANDALQFEGQTTSFTALVSKQLELAGGSALTQGFVSENSVGINLANLSVFDLKMRTDCKGVSSLGPVRRASSGDASVFSQILGTKNNMSVPFMLSTDVVSTSFGNASLGAGNYNPFYTRIASNPSSSSVKTDAISQQGSFFIVALGEEDILKYAQSGGTKSYTPNLGASGVGFKASLEELVNGLSANGAKGVIQNIPDVTSMPYFTTIAWDNLVLTTDQATQLNVFVQPIGITLYEGRNGFIIEDPSVPSGYRKMVEGELVLLSTPLDSVKCNGYGSQIPFYNRHVLTASEITEIENITFAYNQTIVSVALNKNLALADAQILYLKVKNGFTVNGMSISNKFVQGNFYSLDGRYLCPIGQALLANEYLKAINMKFNSTLPLLIPTNYSGIKFL